MIGKAANFRKSLYKMGLTTRFEDGRECWYQLNEDCFAPTENPTRTPTKDPTPCLPLCFDVF